MKTNSKNPILISFVNHHFGPIRGLNFLIDEEQNESLNSWLQTQPNHLISAIWAKTALSTRAMIMPNQMLDELETPPKKVGSIQEGGGNSKGGRGRYFNWRPFLLSIVHSLKVVCC